MLIDLDCPICAGTGVLHLGRPALSIHHPDVVADAIELALEASARASMTAKPATAQAALRDRVEALRTAGLLARPGQTTPAVAAPTVARPRGFLDRHTQARQLADTVPGASTAAGDRAHLDAPPIDWSPYERPLDTGSIPGFSCGGYICAIARATDPYDPLGNDTKSITTARRKRRYDAEALATFAVEHAERTSKARSSA